MRQEKLGEQFAGGPAVDPLKTIAGISGSIARGITWGVSDIAQRGAFEALEALGAVDEGTAEGTADFARESQDALGAWGTAIEMVGGMGTGGVMAKAGKTMAQRLALSATEGAVAGTLYTAGREASGGNIFASYARCK